MKAIIFSLLLIASVMSAEITRDEGVLVLTDDNFQQAISENKFLLVEFYAPWCGHCKKLAPEYAKAAATLVEEGLNIAKVDATVQKELGKKYEVSGYPTLKFFVDGVPSEYNGGRTDSEIVAWIRKKTGPPSKEFQTFADLSNFVDQQEVVVVFFGSNAELFHVYENTARVTEDVTFAHCSSEECLSKYNASNGQVVVFKKFDEKRNDLTTAFNESQLTHFINSNSSAKVMKFDEKCAQLIFGKNTPGIFFYRDPNASDANKYQELATVLSEKLGGKLKVIVTGITDGLEARLAEYIGVTQADLPTVRIHDTRVDLKKFNMSGDITLENVEQFVNNWEKGTLEAHLKSEDVPATNDGPVFVLVGKQFKEVVLDPTKDVLVEFYAPWCGHCKKLAPIYDELGEKMKKLNPDVIIAKMDSTANEAAEVSIQGFPTIKFWPKGNKENPIDYSGERDLNGFMSFLEKHATGFKKEDL